MDTNDRHGEGAAEGEGTSALGGDETEPRFRIARAYELAWHAVQLARIYRRESGAAARAPLEGSNAIVHPVDLRVVACVDRVRELRSFIREQRTALRGLQQSASEVRPGLRKAEANDPRHPRQTEQTYEIRFTKKMSYKS